MALVDVSNAEIKYVGPQTFNTANMGFASLSVYPLIFDDEKQMMGNPMITSATGNGILTLTINFVIPANHSGSGKFYLGFSPGPPFDASKIIYEISNVGAYEAGDNIAMIIEFNFNM